MKLESDSDFSKSESGIPGGDNLDAKVLSRSSFSFTFESVITEELDLMNKNAANSEYFSMPHVYYID